MPKSRLQRRIDAKLTPKSGGGGAPSSGAAIPNIIPPAPPQVAAPDNLSLTTSIGSSTAAPTARISATWDAPPGVIPQGYVIQASTGSTFPIATTRTESTIVRSALIENLPPGILHYVRVAARVQGVQGAWSDMLPLVLNQNYITTATDTIPAGVPTSVSATWIGVGDLLITWTNPTEANFKDVQVVIRASSGGTIYYTAYSASGAFLYPLAWNYRDTGGVGDSSLYVELKSRTFSNVLGTVVNTGLLTKSAPATPTGLSQSWSGDTAGNGLAAADWTLKWTRADDAYRYRLAIDTINRQMSNADSYTLTYGLNLSEHGGTADPALAYSLVAVDGFGQISTAASGSARNYDPPTPTVVISQGAVSTIKAVVGGVQAADFDKYEFTFKRDGTTVRTLESPASEQDYEMSAVADAGYHSWTCVVRQKDLFGQYSATATSGAVAFESLTLGGLRKQARYSDNLGNTEAALAVLKDGSTTAGGITYPA
jgi:hypothetical protein